MTYGRAGRKSDIWNGYYFQLDDKLDWPSFFARRPVDHDSSTMRSLVIVYCLFGSFDFCLRYKVSVSGLEPTEENLIRLEGQ